MRKLRIVNCELRLEAGRSRVKPHSQFTIHNSQFSVPLLFLAASLSFAATPTPRPTMTPTPRPKLSGGFGRAANTPIAVDANGQSFADVVHAASEAKARKEQKPNVAITNETLVTDPKKGKLTTSQPRNLPAPTPAKGAEPTPAPTAAAGAAPAAAPAGEAEWRERARSARKRVEEAKARVFQLEGEAAALEKDFYRWDDGQYRDGVIKPAWDRKRQEVEAARKDLEQAARDLADLPEAARKAGALPGWIRE